MLTSGTETLKWLHTEHFLFGSTNHNNLLTVSSMKAIKEVVMLHLVYWEIMFTYQYHFVILYMALVNKKSHHDGLHMTRS